MRKVCWDNRRKAKDKARAFVSRSQTGYVPYTFYTEIIVMIKPSQMTTQLLSLPHLHSWACVRFPAVLQTMSKLNTHSCFHPAFQSRLRNNSSLYKPVAYVLCISEKTVYQSLIRFWAFHLHYNKHIESRGSRINLTRSHFCMLTSFVWLTFEIWAKQDMNVLFHILNRSTRTFGIQYNCSINSIMLITTENISDLFKQTHGYNNLQWE